MEQFGRYELRRRIGAGGMAEVYEAVAFIAEGVEKPVVIKRILEEHSRDEAFRAMFINEARIAMSLSHPNVVQVFDFGVIDDRYFLAMELVRGKDLGVILSRAKQDDRIPPAGVAIFIAAETAKGLDHAHRLTGADGKLVGLVHRDVSPQNVLISTEGNVKIGDFGIAKFNSRDAVTQATTVRGKVRYMSPEQVEAKSLDARSDLFSLGVVLYEMVTGVHAFDGKNDFDVLAAVRKAKPVPPSQLAKVPQDLETIVMKTLSREPRDRYPRGADLARALETFAMAEGLRATSGEVAEFIAAIFPELQRVSDEGGATVIRRIPDLPLAQDSLSESISDFDRKELPDENAPPRPSADRTQVRRMPDAKDGMKVYVSQEVPQPPPETTAGSSTRSTAFEIDEYDSASASADPTREGTGLNVGASDPTSERTDPSSLDLARAARARARSEKTDARMPMPPPEVPRDVPQDIPTSLRERTRPGAQASGEDDDGEDPSTEVTDRGARAAPVGAVTDAARAAPPREDRISATMPAVARASSAPTDKRPPAPPMPLPVPPAPAARKVRRTTGSQSAPLTLALVVVLVAGAAVGLRMTRFGRSLFTRGGGDAEQQQVIPDLTKGSSVVGYLELYGRTNDKVTIDGTEVGVLPLPVLTVSSGFHEVVVSGWTEVVLHVHVLRGHTERLYAEAGGQDGSR